MWLYHLDACAGSVLTPRLHHQRTKDSATGPTRVLVRAAHVDHSWTQFGRGLCMLSRRLGKTKTRGNRNHHGKQWIHRSTVQRPLLSRDAARLWTCVWHPPMQQQLEGMLHGRPNPAVTRTYTMQQTLQRAVLVNRCQTHPFSTDGSMKSK